MTKDNKRFRLDSLIRVSQRGGREAKDIRSPDQQREIIGDWLKTNRAEVAQEHVNIGLSGKTMDRADIRAVLERVRAGKTDGLIVAFASRLSRARLGEVETFRDALLDAGGRLVICDIGGEYADTAVGEFAFSVLFAASRLQWRQVKERYEQSRRNAIEAGKAIGRPPFGYRYKDPTPKQRASHGVLDSRLVPDEETASLIPELFRRKAEGASWLELARWLDQAAPKPDGRHWARQTVVGMIRSRTYLGEVRHGTFVRADAHEPLVSVSLWRRAQNEPGKRTPRGTYLLSGLVRCAGCGRNMRASSGGTKKPAVYVCIQPQCELRYSTVVVDKIDAEVIEQFFARLDAFHVRAVDDAEIDSERAEVARLGDDLASLVQLKVSHPKALAAHQEAVSDLERRLQESEDHLAALLDAKAQSGPDARELRADWPSLSMDERREILRAGIDAVLVRRAIKTGAGSVMAERIRVIFHGDAPADLVVRRGRMRSWTWTDEPGSLRAAA
jgi:DNA invertase Pin-like site-specific DNA recombinase